MFNFHLEVAAAKAAIARAKTKPMPRPVRAIKLSPPPPQFNPDDSKRKRNNSPNRGSASQSSSAIRIPNFSVSEFDWNGDETEFPIDEETKMVRRQVLQSVNECLTKQNAPSTILSYESILNKEVGEAQNLLDTILLPLDSEQKFLALFGFLKANSTELKWSRVQALKSALVKFHDRNNSYCIFSDWTPRMQAMWTGLSRSSAHASKGKDPIEFSEVMAFFSSTANDESHATIRFRAMVAVGFFGVRRCAEILNFSIADVSIQSNGDFSLLVKCQKNDQEGIGMMCVIPTIRALGKNSPASLLEAWLSCRTAYKKSESDKEPLFCTVTGAANRIGNSVSPDSFRKALGAVFTGNTSTHSLRKGGARFYAAAQAPEQATRDQGGWRTTEVMRHIYTSLTTSEVKNAIHDAANSAGYEFALQSLTEELANVEKSGLAAEVNIANQYIQLLDDMIDAAPWKILSKFNVGKHAKRLVTHPDDAVRLSAVSALGKLRSAWASHQSANRSD